MKKKVKKWQKVIAAIVLAAFLFQCGPVYALDQLPINTSNLPAATETKESTESDTEAITEEETEDASAGEETETSLGVEKKAENVSSIFDSASEYDSPEVLTDVLSGVETERENDKVLSSSTKHEIDGELEELREANVKYFLNTDKSITAATYPYDIHYLNDEGVYEEIDNSLVDGTDSDTGDALENTANNMGVKFAKKAKESNMVKMQFDGHKISWGLENANKKKSVRDNTLAQFNFSHDPLLLQDKMSTVSYSAIRPNINLYYDVIGTTVKERIELLSKDAERSFRFRYSTKDLVLTEEEGQIVLKDQAGKTVFVMEPLYMYDAAGAESSDVTYTLETIKDNRNNHEYILTVTAGSKWLDAEERVYPVTVDPTVTLKKENLNFYDAHVNSDSPNTNTNSTGTCTVGTNSRGTSYIYTKFTLPSDIKESDRIVSAELAFEPFTNDSVSIFASTVKAGPYLCAYETTADWNPSTITWNNKPAFGSDVIDYDKVDSNSRWYTWDITKILQGNGLGNKTYGVTLRSYNDESFSKRCYFYSSNSRYGSSTYPFVQVTYLNMKGLEDYWTYHSQSAGLAGTGYINDFTGNLTAVFEDFTVSSERLPMNVSHVYTGYNAGQHQSSLDVGSGFRLSIQESVAKKTIAGETKYLYTDGDGTEHYFEKDNAGNWVDDSGLDLKLTIDTSEYTITDKKDNKRVFSVASTYLKYIRDNKGNTLTLNYDGSNRLLSISDDSASKGASANRTITFNRQSGTNLLESMTYNGRTIYYSYTDTGNGYGSCLTQVTFPGGSTLSGWTSSSGSQVAKFVYTASGSLTDLIDATQNVGLHYGYLWQSGIRRVNEYSTCSYNGTTPILKNRYFIEYKQDHNIYTETAVSSGYPATGRWEKYYFNNMGQTISAQDQDGNALYSEQGIEGDSKNKVTFASKTQKTITNLLKNHSFENGLTGFSASSSSVAVVDGTKDYPALYGSKVLRMRATRAGCSATQTVSVRGGQSYTLSAYIRTTGAAYGFLELSCSSASATIKKTSIKQTGSYKRYDVTLDLTGTSSSSTMDVSVKFGAASRTLNGYVFFDAVQLESGECANRYNMIENGSFERDEDWTYVERNTGNPSGVYDGRDSVCSSGAYGIILNGQPAYKKMVRQVIPVSGKKGEGLVFGTWVRSNAIPNKDTQYDGSKQSIGMTVDLLSASGEYLQTRTVTLTPTPNEWTYACGEMIANVDYASIRVHLKANYNANKTYFDDVQVYKDTFGESFVYDGKGNVKTVRDMALSTQNAITNGNSDLSEYTDGKGFKYSFVYDGGNTSAKTHNLTRTTAPDGTYTAMAYYSNGLLQYVSVYDKNGTTAIRTQKTYNAAGNNYLATSVDQLQKSTAYNYDANSGLLHSVSEPYGSGNIVSTSYVYNNERLTRVSKDNQTIDYSYDQNRISSIAITGSNQTSTYSLGYTALGNLASVNRSVNGGDAVNLESYTYDESRGNQSSMSYGNGQSLYYTYDNQDRLVGISDGSAPISKLFYNSNGLLGKAYSYDGSTTWNEYQYDFAERYVGTQSSEGFGTHNITYDKNDNNTGYTATLNGLAYSSVYGYNNVNNLHTMYLKNSSDGIFAKEYLAYDGSGRVSAMQNCAEENITSAGVWTAYNYLDPKTGTNTTSSSTHTTNLVSEMRLRFTSTSDSGENTDYKYNYSYDDAGNVNVVQTTLKSGAAYSTTYRYDSRGQLTQAYNLNNDSNTYAYSYDKRGNITRSDYRSSSPNVGLINRNMYTYNSAIPDELSSVTMKVGDSYTTRNYAYDAIGNPISIMDSNETSNSGKNLSWKQGKQLGEVEFVVDGNVTKACSYYYDESGRIKKIDQESGNYIKYHYDSDNLEYEEHYVNNSRSYLIKYFYDDQDRVQFALYKNRNFSTSDGYYNLYTYVYNGLGEITDIVKVRDGLSSSAPSISNLPVAHYEYDPYGNIVSINTYNDDTFGNINPIRYKAYYYDTDLGWYNLGSRYYDPSVGRFINCDSIGIINNNASDIENKNLYAYCNNNPVMYYDDGGDVPVIVVYMLVSGIVNVAIDHTCAIIAGEDYSLTDGLLSFVCGAASINKKADYAIMGLQLGYDVFVKNSSVGDALFNTACSVGTRKVSDNISKALDISIPQTKKEVFSLALVDSTVTGGLKMAGSAGSNFLPRTPSLNVRFPKIKIRTCSIKYKKRVRTRSNLKFLFRKQFRLMRKK